MHLGPLGGSKANDNGERLLRTCVEKNCLSLTRGTHTEYVTNVCGTTVVGKCKKIFVGMTK